MSEVIKTVLNYRGEEGAIFFLLLFLASYRLTRMIAMEDGPFDVFLNFRGWIYEKYDPENTQEANIVRLIECPYCISVWTSLILYFSPVILIFPLGIAGAVSLLMDFFKEKIFR
jgi:hypothetical protein